MKVKKLETRVRVKEIINNQFVNLFTLKYPPFSLFVPTKKEKKCIYIYCDSQTDCFVVSRHFSVARHVGRLKLGSKPTRLFC